MFLTETAYVAHQNDLYEVQYNPWDGAVHKVTLYEDNASRNGEEKLFWQLPEATRRRILAKINRGK